MAQWSRDMIFPSDVRGPRLKSQSSTPFLLLGQERFLTTSFKWSTAGIGKNGSVTYVWTEGQTDVKSEIVI